MVAKKIVQASHYFRAKMNLKITFFCKGKMRVNRGFRRDTGTNDMSGIIPVNFGEKCRVEVQSVPFKGDMPNAVRVNLMTFRHCYLEFKSSQHFRRKELSRLS